MKDSASASFGEVATRLRPPSEWSERLRWTGVWRDGDFLTDLERWSRTTPDAIAVHARTARTGRTTRVSYADYARHVERFAGALSALGVLPGQVVAIQLPNWWQTSALMLACMRAGAVFAPLMPSLRARELERVLRLLDAAVCVTTDRWDGFAHAETLAELAPRLPKLRHRVVFGESTAEDETDFSAHFEQIPWEHVCPAPITARQSRPDRVALTLFTSGTTGEPKAALHTLNTMYATAHPFVLSDGYGPRDAFFTPHALSHTGGFFAGLGMPLLTGGSAVLMDAWEPCAAFDLMAEAGVSFVIGAPLHLSALTAEGRTRRTAVSLPALRTVMAIGTPVLRPLVRDIADAFGLPLRTAWGMTEAGQTYTRIDDPPDWAVHSVGKPGPGVELELRSEDGEITVERPARLHIRGGPVALATVGLDCGALTVVAERDDGWYDTGDLAVPDGRDGIRLVGRAADRIGRTFMIPAQDVESALLDHDAIDDVAVVGSPAPGSGGGPGEEIVCAVIASEGKPPGLDAIHGYLKGMGMTEWYWPSRVEYVPRLPRTGFGKVRKELLKRWLLGEAELSDD